MIEQTLDLTIFYKNYGQEFINHFKDENTKFYLFKLKDRVCGHFMTYLDRYFPDQLFFGCFDLFDASYSLKEFREHLVFENQRLGKKQIIGPIDFSIWFGNRIKTMGHEHQFWWEPKGLEYWNNSFEEQGFLTEKKYVTHFFDDISRLKFFFQASYTKSLENGFKLLDFNEEYAKNPNEILKRCYELNCDAFNESHFFKSITLEEYSKFIFSKITLIDNSLSCFIANSQNLIVGYSFCLKDRDTMGALGILKSILVHPEYQAAGLSSALVYESLERAIKSNIQRGAAALIRQGAKSEFLFAKVANDLSTSHHYELFYL